MLLSKMTLLAEGAAKVAVEEKRRNEKRIVLVIWRIAIILYLSDQGANSASPFTFEITPENVVLPFVSGTVIWPLMAVQA